MFEGKATDLVVFATAQRYVSGRDATAQLGEQLIESGIEPGPVIIVASGVRGLDGQGVPIRQQRAACCLRSPPQAGLAAWSVAMPAAPPPPPPPRRRRLLSLPAPLARCARLQSAQRMLEQTWEASLGAAGFTFTVVKFGGQCRLAPHENHVGEKRASSL